MVPLSAVPPLLGAHNLSSKHFSLDALMLLNNGLKFIPTPKRITQEQLKASLDRFKRSVRLRCMFQDTGQFDKYKLPNPAFVPDMAPPAVEAFLEKIEATAMARLVIFNQQCVQKPNLSYAQRQVLQSLKQQHDVIIKPADKNLGLTIMPAQAYHEAVMSHVSDTSVYLDVTDTVADVIAAACEKLTRLVRRYECVLGPTLCKFLLQGVKMKEPPHLYIMPKLHKMKSLSAPIVGRPIAACHSWVTTNASIWLADVLNGCVADYPTIVTDRTHLIRELEGLRVSKDAWLLTFDIESLYPHVEHEGCIDACTEAVHNPMGDVRYRLAVQDFLRFVLQNNVVSVQGKKYKQVFGGAMGTNCMPPAAQLYLARKWETKAKAMWAERFPDKPFPDVFRRFIDDGFVIFEGSEQDMLDFLDVLNTVMDNIKITFHYSRFEVEFLDVVIYKCMEDALLTGADGTVRLKVKTHQKALNKYLYIPYNSYHHPGVFKSFIHAELLRYVVTNSDECWYNCMVRKFIHRLRQRGYPLAMVESLVRSVSYDARQRYLSGHNSASSGPAQSVWVVPYAQLMPQLRLPQLLREHYESSGEALHTLMPQRPIVAYTKNRSLGSLLVKASH
jgi:hypothetical protein